MYNLEPFPTFSRDMPCVFCNKESVTEVGIGFQTAHAETLSFCKPCFSQAEAYFDGELATPNKKLRQFVETEAFYIYWEYKQTIAQNRKMEHIKHQQAQFQKSVLQDSSRRLQEEEDDDDDDEEEEGVDIEKVHEINPEEEGDEEYDSYSESEEETTTKRKRDSPKDFLDDDVSADERPTKKVKPPLLLSKQQNTKSPLVIANKEKPKNPNEVVVLEEDEHQL